MEFLRKRILHLSDIPRDLDSVITVDKKKEVDPQLACMAQDAVDEIWHNIVKLYKTGVHPGISVSIRHRGKVLMSRGIGLPLISHHILPLVNVIRTIANRTPKVDRLRP